MQGVCSWLIYDSVGLKILTNRCRSTWQHQNITPCCTQFGSLTRHCNRGAKNKANCASVAGLWYLLTDIYFRKLVEGEVEFMSVSWRQKSKINLINSKIKLALHRFLNVCINDEILIFLFVVWAKLQIYYIRYFLKIF